MCEIRVSDSGVAEIQVFQVFTPSGPLKTVKEQDCSSCTAWHWRSHCYPSKRRYLFTRWHNATSQKNC